MIAPGSDERVARVETARQEPANFVPGESSPLSALSIGGADALTTTRAMREALRAAGVRVQGTTRRARAGGWPLAVRYSPPLPEILRQMDVESDNHTAELVL